MKLGLRTVYFIAIVALGSTVLAIPYLSLR
jgi:hypothetical protein